MKATTTSLVRCLVLALLVPLCHCGGSDSSHQSRYSEADIASGMVADPKALVVSMLEHPDSPPEPAIGDTGDLGSDLIPYDFEQGIVHTFRLEHIPGQSIRATVLDRDLHELATLDSSMRERELTLLPGRYFVRVEHTGEDPRSYVVFLRPGSTTVSRNCPGCDLASFDLASRDISDGNFQRAQLQGAKLSGVRCRNSDFSGANLSGADLSGADCRNASFTGADLSAANLSGIHAEGALFHGAQGLSGEAPEGAVGFGGGASATFNVPPGQTVIFNSPSVQTLNYQTVTLGDGATLLFRSDARLTAAQIVSNGQAFIRVVGYPGSNGPNAPNAELCQSAAAGSPGTIGGAGPNVLITTEFLSGDFVVQVAGGDGGDGGRGGNGAPAGKPLPTPSITPTPRPGFPPLHPTKTPTPLPTPCSPGSGGSGGRGADGGPGGSLTLYYSRLAPGTNVELDRSTSVSQGGKGGKGGTGGEAAPGNQNGPDGQPGADGAPGAIGSFVLAPFGE